MTKKIVVGSLLFLALIFSLTILALAQASSNLDNELLNAAMAGDVTAVKLLLDKGATTEAKSDKGGYTALIWAAWGGKADMLKLLLDKGANIEAKNNQGFTALIEAAARGKADVVKLLLDKRADINAKDKDGYTALSRAILWNVDLVIVKLLLDKGANIETAFKDGSALFMALAKADMVKLLLDKGANVNAKDKDGIALVNRARLFNHQDVVKLLLDRGAYAEVKDDSINTVLIGAVKANNTTLVKALLDKGANIEAKDRYGETLLYLAVENGNADVLKLLLDRGADIQAKDPHGYTVLESAALECERLEIVVKEGSRSIFIEEGRSKLKDATEIVELLQQAFSQNPQAHFLTRLNEFRSHPSDEARREMVVKLAAGLQTLPEIPEEARQLFIQASALMKVAKGAEEMTLLIEKLEEALKIAPWWANAYYNLSRALELSGEYDEAVKQLNYYLKLNPPEADAREARDHIYAIQAEKEAAAQRQQKTEQQLAVKYVSGGATRLRKKDAPSWWGTRGWEREIRWTYIEELFTYSVPEEDPFYVNVFRMPNGRILAITLNAQSNNGAYAGDQVWISDITEETEIRWFSFVFGAQKYRIGFRYNISVSDKKPDATVTVAYPDTGASVTIPVALLYRGRALKGAWSGVVYQGLKEAQELHFDNDVLRAMKDPKVNALSLTPTTVTPAKNAR